MSATTGFAIAISGQDAGVQAMLKRLTGSIDTLTGNLDKMGKGSRSLGDTAGVTRLTDGMDRFGGSALNAFRAVDRLVPAMGALAGVGSVGGMLALTRSWAELGTRVQQTSYRLAMPADQLSGLEFAARRAGSSTASLDAGLKTLQDRLYGAAWGRDPQAIQDFRALGISPGTPGHVTEVADAFIKLSEAMQGVPEHQQVRMLQIANVPEDLLPLFRQGPEAIRKMVEEGSRLGGIFTPSMARHADELRTSYERFGTALSGVGNRLAEQLAGPLKGIMDWSTEWIAKNHGVSNGMIGTADSIALLGAAATTMLAGLAVIKPAQWVLRLLGLATLAELPVVPAIIAGAGAVDVFNRPFGNVATQADEDKITGHEPTPPHSPYPGQGWREFWYRFQRNFGSVRPADRTYDISRPWWNGVGRNNPGGASAPFTATPETDRAAQESMKFWLGKGLTPEHAAGMAAQEIAESGGNPNARGDRDPVTGEYQAHGAYQWHPERRRQLRMRAGIDVSNATIEQQREAAYWEYTHTEPTARDMLDRARGPEESGAAGTEFERPGNRAAEERRRAQIARRAFQRNAGAPFAASPDAAPSSAPNGDAGPDGATGHVLVDINVTGMPPGTSARTTTRGNVVSPPPRIETSLPYAR